jgi:2-polyprenyl-3-methyl-5-hydroxy-6-metoxy-1,4-benzoquinol methylase
MTAGAGTQNSPSYRFEPVDSCNMCGVADAKVLGRRLNAHQGLRVRDVVGVATTVLRCRACGLIYSNPRPIPSTIAQHYDRPPGEYWQQDDWQPGERDSVDRHVATFRSLWSGTRTPRALDVGAGLGQTMASLAQLGFDVYGFEPSLAFHGRALERGVDPHRLVAGSIEEVDHPAGAFDLITFEAVLEHLHDPAGSLGRALEWTAPGGLIYVEVPSADWLMAALANRAYRLLGTDYVTNLSPMHPPYHLYEFTRECFEHHPERAGYEIVSCRLHVCNTFASQPIAALARYVMEKWHKGMQLEIWLRKR